MLTRPIRPASDNTPKNVPPTGTETLKLPSAALVGLNTVMITFPGVGPAYKSNPAASAAVNVRFRVSINTFAPRTLLLLDIPGNKGPRTAIELVGSPLYV